VPRFLVTIFAALTMMLVLPVSSHALARGAESCAGAYTAPTAVAKAKAKVRAATLCLINRERAVRRMRTLRPHGALTLAAHRHSTDMAIRNYFAHDTKGGGRFTSRILAARYVRPNMRWSVGENLAWGTGQLATPAAIVEAWMRSPGHRANILKGAYAEIGIGIATSGAKIIYTTDFGRRH
jgi:uncharacterized protein YkwD